MALGLCRNSRAKLFLQEKMLFLFFAQLILCYLCNDVRFTIIYVNY